MAEDGNLCGESPLWNPAWQSLIWTDISSSLVYQLDPVSGKKETISRELTVAGITRNANDTLIFAGPTGMHLRSRQGQHHTFLVEHEGEMLFFNDMIADFRGRIYAGTCYWGPSEMEKTGKLYLVDINGVARTVDDGIELSNGLGLSGNQKILYYSDTSARKIYAYDVDLETGSLTEKRIFVNVPGTEGIPDGLTVDAEDHVWSAQWYGGRIVRYDPDGKVERWISLPVKQVSSIAFGGKDFSDLYITSAAESWHSRYSPLGYDYKASNLGGSLYRLRSDISGRPEHEAAIRPLT